MVYSPKGVSQTITAGCHGYSCGNIIVEVDIKMIKIPNEIKRLGNILCDQFGTGYAGNVWDQKYICPALMTMQGGV